MKFSIIIPMYNVQEYIRDCINSILKQNFYDMEIIVVDDGSTDKSVNVVKEIINKRKDNIITLVTKENGGASEARNIGISYASGEYLVFMDSDDIMTQNALSIMMKVAKSEADLCVFSAYEKTKGKIKESKLTRCKCFNYSSSESINVLDEYLKRTNYAVSWQPWSKLFKRSIVVENNIKFNPMLYSCNDFNFFFKFFLHVESVVFDNSPVTIYNSGRPGSISSTKTMRRIESNSFAFAELFKDIYLIDKERLNILEYASYLFLCVFDLCEAINNEDLKRVKEIKNRHRYVYNYSKRKYSVIRRLLFSLFGFKYGAKIYGKLRETCVSIFKMKRISDL